MIQPFFGKLLASSCRFHKSQIEKVIKLTNPYLYQTYVFVFITLFTRVWPALRAGEFTLKKYYTKIYFNFIKHEKFFIFI